MTHARVEAERVDDEAALVLGARDADGPASLELRDLPNHAPHGARRRRHDDGLAGPRAAEVEQADVRGEPGIPRKPSPVPVGRWGGSNIRNPAAVGTREACHASWTAARSPRMQGRRTG